MNPLLENACGFPIDFSPLGITEGGNMVLWHDSKGGAYPWDNDYYGGDDLGNATSSTFDATYIMQHATDSAATATTLATGQKVSSIHGRNQTSIPFGCFFFHHSMGHSPQRTASQVANKMISVNLYEEEVKTILEDAMSCGMSGGAISSVPILHATPAAFVAHSNDRKNHEQLRRSFRQVNPTLAIGTCAERLFPYENDLESMRNGAMSSLWTLFEIKDSNTTSEVRPVFPTRQ